MACGGWRVNPKIVDLGLGVAWPSHGDPFGPEIGKLCLHALDIKAKRRASRKGELDITAWGRPLQEIDSQQIEDRTLARRINPTGLEGIHALETQRRSPAAKLRGRAFGAFPIETIEWNDETTLCRNPNDLADGHHGVLDMAGDDFKIFLVEGYELEWIHNASPGGDTY